MFTNSLIPSMKNDIWADFSDVFDEFDHLMNSNRFDFSQSFPAMNVYVNQDDRGFYLEMALAGLSKDCLNVEISGSDLIISANVPENKEDDSKHFFKRRIQNKSFKRTYIIPEFCDVDKIDVSFVEGLLTVFIPIKSKEVPESKKIVIK